VIPPRSTLVSCNGDDGFLDSVSFAFVPPPLLLIPLVALALPRKLVAVAYALLGMVFTDLLLLLPNVDMAMY
jgi:hypothetical protein